MVKLPEAKHGFILLLRHWVVERSFTCVTHSRRLVNEYKGYASTLVGRHCVAGMFT